MNFGGLVYDGFYERHRVVALLKVNSWESLMGHRHNLRATTCF